MQQRVNRRIVGSLLVFLCILIFFSALLFAKVNEASSDTGTRAPYTCDLTVFIVEPESRYTDYGGVPYGDGFLFFAYDTTLNLAQEETFNRSVIWDGGFLDITEDNIKAIAVVFNGEGHTAYSDPPSGAPFTAHYVDAAAEAIPGETGYDQAVDDYTHTVFVLEGTQHG